MIGRVVAALGLSLGLAPSCATGPGATEPVDGVVSVVDPWIRPTPPITNVGAFYFTLANRSPDPDRLLGASSPRCAQTEIHRTDTVDGVASMRPADPEDLMVAPGEDLVFEPNGLHLMCLGLDRPVEADDQVPLTLEFEHHDPLTLAAPADER